MNPPRSASLLLAQLLLLAAGMVSGWLAYQTLTAELGCQAGGDCSAVTTSLWAQVLGVPIALVGGMLYLALLLLLWCRPLQNARVGQLAATACLLILGSALWFMALQAVIIRSFCPYCCLIHGLAGTAAVLILWTLLTRSLQVGSMTLPLVASATGLVSLVALQFFVPPPTQTRVLSTDQHHHGTAAPPALFSLSSDGAPLFGGMSRNPSATSPPDFACIDLPASSTAPPSSPVALGLLYDWSCEYCLHLHQLLSDLSDRTNGQGSHTSPLMQSLVITLLPHAHTEEAASLHQQMAQLSSHAPDTYDQLILELHHGIRTPSELPTHLPTLLHEHGLSPTHTSETITRRLAIAAAQLQHNAQTLHVQTVPQLFSRSQVLTGAPTPEEIVAFLNSAQ